MVDDLLVDLLSRVRRLADSFASGNAMKEGIPLAIVGAPNRGKSTCSCFARRRSVSSRTFRRRDTVEDTCTIEGCAFDSLTLPAFVKQTIWSRQRASVAHSTKLPAPQQSSSSSMPAKTFMRTSLQGLNPCNSILRHMFWSFGTNATSWTLQQCLDHFQNLASQPPQDKALTPCAASSSRSIGKMTKDINSW